MESIVPQVITKDNFLNWSILVKSYLRGRDLWDDVIGGEFNNADIHRVSKDAEALHIIQLACGFQNLYLIRHCRTARNAWNELKTIFSDDDLKAKVEGSGQGGLLNDLDLLHSAAKRGSWDTANSIIGRNNLDIVSQPSSLNGWTSLHFAVAAEQHGFMRELVGRDASLLYVKDREGYTPLALAAISTDDTTIADWIVSAGGNGLLTMDINADDPGKGDIPVLLAAAKGHKKMARYLFSRTDSDTLLANNCYYAGKLLSHCIHAEIFDVAAALLQHIGTQLPLTYESDQCKRPICGLACIPTAFPSGTKLNFFQQTFYKILWVPNEIDIEGKKVSINSHDDNGESTTEASPSPGKIRKLQEAVGSIVTGFLVKLPGVKTIYEEKVKHYLVDEIMRCFWTIIEEISSEKLYEWSVEDAMLHAAKNGIVEFIDVMREADSYLLGVTDTNRRGLLFHAIMNRQEEMVDLIYEIDGRQKGLTDAFENNILHLAAELAPSTYHSPRSNAALQMQKDLHWFKEVESIVPPKCREAKNTYGFKPRELFAKNHEQLAKDGYHWAKDIASTFTIIGTLFITLTFAASYAAPAVSKTDKHNLMAHPLFVFANALSLAASSTSVLFFIGIITSSYVMEDFGMSFPIKLLFGTLTMFYSMVFLFCAHSSNITETLAGHGWMGIAAISLAFIPCTMFLLLLRPYMSFTYLLRRFRRAF